MIAAERNANQAACKSRRAPVKCVHDRFQSDGMNKIHSMIVSKHTEVCTSDDVNGKIA